MLAVLRLIFIRCARLDKGSYGWLHHAGIDSIVGFYRTSKTACRVTARGAAEWSRAAFLMASFRTPPVSLPITPAISAALASFIPWHRRIQTTLQDDPTTRLTVARKWRKF